MPQLGTCPTPSSERLLLFFEQVAQNAGDYALLLGGGHNPSKLNQWNIIGVGARQVIRLYGTHLECNGVVHDLSPLPPPEASRFLFEKLEQARQHARSWAQDSARKSPLPMAGGLAGAFGYGFYRWCDEGWQPQHTKPIPDFKIPSELATEQEYPDLLLIECEDWLFIPADFSDFTVLSDSDERRAFYEKAWKQSQNADAGVTSESLLTASFQSESSQSGLLSPAEQALYLENFERSLAPSSFENAVGKIQQAIQRGELYQANLSLRLKKKVTLNPLALFAQLCKQNPSPFSGFFRWPGGLIVSNSPERLVQVETNGQAHTRPIAGTRGRGQTIEEETQIAHTLLENEKELAEHRMLVDLARNDLGRVCQTGSVQVDELLALERYSHVTHLVSNVTGKLRAEASPWGTLRALFPGGTITGCPKVRCVNILRQVEPAPRGFYTGSLGYMDARSPAMDWNILIRSVFLQELPLQPMGAPLTYNAHIHVGAGIVHDAVGRYEYRECLRKASASLNALAVFENREILQSLF